jgi:hydroxymethylbilane synthase
VLTGEADVAVHSLKDLPTLGPAELVLAAIPERGPTGDVLLSPSVDRLSDLPRGARIATSSLRRKAQLLRYRSDLVIESIRGNVETRIRKMYDEGFDGLILAEAGVRRLGLDAEIREVIDPQVLLPAVGQGALGIECRTEDVEVIEVLSALDHSDSRACVNAERSLLRTIEGGCQVPVGVRTELAGSELRLAGVVLSPDGTRWREGSVCGSIADATTLGEELGLRFLEEGAAELLL